MIESQSELPTPRGEPLALRERGQQVIRTITSRIRASAAFGTRGAGYLRDAGSWARRKTEQVPFRNYLGRALHWVVAGVGDGSLLNRFALKPGVLGTSFFAILIIYGLLSTFGLPIMSRVSMARYPSSFS